MECGRGGDEKANRLKVDDDEEDQKSFVLGRLNCLLSIELNELVNEVIDELDWLVCGKRLELSLSSSAER